MTQNEHVYAICCGLELADVVTSGKIITTIEGYEVLNFEVTNFSSFRDIQTKSFRRRRTSTITLRENAFAFRLTTAHKGNQLTRWRTDWLT